MDIKTFIYLFCGQRDKTQDFWSKIFSYTLLKIKFNVINVN